MYLKVQWQGRSVSFCVGGVPARAGILASASGPSFFKVLDELAGISPTGCQVIQSSQVI
jgi:hypothetical protein